MMELQVQKNKLLTAPWPERICFIEAPLRDRLVHARGGVIFISDRFLHVFVLLENFHKLEFARVLIEHLLLSSALAQAELSDDWWIAAGLSHALGRQIRPARLNFMSAIHHGRSIAGLTAVQSNALVLDWETNESQTYHRQGEILTAWDVDPGRWPDPDAPDSERTGMVYYRFQSGPLWDDVELLSEAVARLNIGTVLVLFV